MIDTAYEHESLIFLFRFNVQFVSNGKFCVYILCVLSLTFIFM